MEKEDKRRVIHVEMKATGKHRYFASPAAIYDFQVKNLELPGSHFLTTGKRRKNLMKMLFAL